jgi:hypothetical protein
MAFTHTPGWRAPTGNTLKASGAGGKYGALAIRFTDPRNPEKDISSEYFSNATDFANTDNSRVPTMVNHGLPLGDRPIFKAFADRIFGLAELKRLDNGIFGTITLDPADAMASALADLIEAGALKFSSGSGMQFVRRGADGGILKWRVLELSVTATPMEFRLPKLRKI